MWMRGGKDVGIFVFDASMTKEVKVYLSCIKYDKIFYLIPEMEKACMFYSSSRIGMPLVALVEQVQGSGIG